jgi:hypothetical protein
VLGKTNHDLRGTYMCISRENTNLPAVVGIHEPRWQWTIRSFPLSTRRDANTTHAWRHSVEGAEHAEHPRPSGRTFRLGRTYTLVGADAASIILAAVVAILAMFGRHSRAAVFVGMHMACLVLQQGVL